MDVLLLEKEMEARISAKEEDLAMALYQQVRAQWDDFMMMHGFDETMPNVPGFLVQYQPGKGQRAGAAGSECGPFHTVAWVWTRMCSMVVPLLARTGKHETEAELLQALLNQRLCCRMKRGGWWERLLLVLEKLAKRDKSEVALQRVSQAARIALEDPYLFTGKVLPMGIGTAG